MIDQEYIAVAEAADELLHDKERLTTRAEARLALALHNLGPPFEIIGKEECTCGADCDECAPKEQILASLKTLAGEL